MKQFAHVTHGNVCLGKDRVKRPLKMLSFSNYYGRASAIDHPKVCAWERPLDWKMLGNDTVGDCTIAAALHMQMAWASVAQSTNVPIFTTNDALDLYSAITGYNPADPNTDQGAVETDVLAYWQNTGMHGNKILGYVAVDVTSKDAMDAATYIFGGLYLGIQVPAYIMNVPAGGSWSYTGSGDTSIEGGHAIPRIGYGEDGATIISWGSLYHWDRQFEADNCEEAYAVVDDYWIKASGRSPSGVDMPSLLADLKAA